MLARVLNWLALLARSEAAKDVEILMLPPTNHPARLSDATFRPLADHRTPLNPRRVPVSPLQVVEQHQQPTLASDHLQQLQHRLARLDDRIDQAPTGRTVHDGPAGKQAAQDSGVGAEPIIDGQRPRSDPHQRFHQRPERPAAPHRVPAQHRHVRGSPAFGDFVEEPALPDAGVTADQNASTRIRGAKPEHAAQLVRTADQRATARYAARPAWPRHRASMTPATRQVPGPDKESQAHRSAGHRHTSRM
jgi:hypothetical protein